MAQEFSLVFSHLPIFSLQKSVDQERSKMSRKVLLIQVFILCFVVQNIFAENAAEEFQLPDPTKTLTLCGRRLNYGLRQYCKPEMQKIILDLSEAVEISTDVSIIKACCMQGCTLKQLVSFCPRLKVEDGHVEYDVEK